jgi:hypothetical protein
MTKQELKRELLNLKSRVDLIDEVKNEFKKEQPELFELFDAVDGMIAELVVTEMSAIFTRFLK